MPCRAAKIKPKFVKFVRMKTPGFILLFLFLLASAYCHTLPEYAEKLIRGKDAKTQVQLLDSIAVNLRHKNFPLSTQLSANALSIAKAKGLKTAIVKAYLTLCRNYRVLGAGLLNQIILSSKARLPSDVLKKLHYHVLRTLNENMQQRESKDGMDIALIRIDYEKKK